MPIGQTMDFPTTELARRKESKTSDFRHGGQLSATPGIIVPLIGNNSCTVFMRLIFVIYMRPAVSNPEE
jgi:hypothetical protein